MPCYLLKHTLIDKTGMPLQAATPEKADKEPQRRPVYKYTVQPNPIW